MGVRCSETSFSVTYGCIFLTDGRARDRMPLPYGCTVYAHAHVAHSEAV